MSGTSLDGDQAMNALRRAVGRMSVVGVLACGLTGCAFDDGFAYGDADGDDGTAALALGAFMVGAADGASSYYSGQPQNTYSRQFLQSVQQREEARATASRARESAVDEADDADSEDDEAASAPAPVRMAATAGNSGRSGASGSRPVQTLPPSSQPPAYTGDGSQRSYYLHAVKLNRWAAEEYRKQGKYDKARECEQRAAEEQRKADALLSSAPAIGRGR